MDLKVFFAKRDVREGRARAMTSQQLGQAIRSNSEPVVRELLESGCDANLLPTPPEARTVVRDGDGKVTTQCRFVSVYGKSGIVTPLLLAVVNVYFNHDGDQESNARAILSCAFAAVSSPPRARTLPRLRYAWAYRGNM